MTPRIGDPRSTWRHRWLGVLGLIAIVAGCGTPAVPGSSLPSGAPGSAGPTEPAASAGPSIDTASAAPSTAASVAPTGGPVVSLLPTETFQYSDILKVQVNRLAAREKPDRTSALVRGYQFNGSSYDSKGEIRLSVGDYVSVHLGPVKVGDIVWYLVWPAPGARLHAAEVEWYTGAPADGSPGPAWVAASVGKDVYMTFHRRPSVTEIEEYLPLGANAAGTGPFESGPQPRHDGFLFDWAAASAEPSEPCGFKVTLVPADASVPAQTAIDTSTSAVKSSPLQGSFVSAPWLPAPDGSWSTFTVKVTGTCRWAFRLTPLHHD